MRTLALCLLLPLWAVQSVIAAAEEPPTREEVDALRNQVEALTRQLEALEARYATGDAPASVTATEAPTAGAPVAAPSPADKESATVSLDDGGLRVTSKDGAFESRIGIKLSHDWAWFNQDRELKRFVGDEQDGTGFRHARLNLRGKVFTDIQYQMEIDFAGESGADTPKFRDVFFQYTGIPYGGDRAFDVRVGHFKEPFGLEELNGSMDRQFLENPLLDVFSPSRNAGIMITDALLGQSKQERLTWAIGAYKETDDIPSSNDSDEDQGYSVTARLTGLPVYGQDGRRLLHLGAAYSLRNPDGARLSYGVRPETRLSIFRYADPDNLPTLYRLRDARAEDVDLLGLELAAIVGPFTFQSEYARSQVETTFGGDLEFSGYYAQALYLLTGEHHPYRHDGARIGSPSPSRPFKIRGEDRGPGAWEIGLRYGGVDLSDGPVPGGEHTSLTVGLNWYMNDNFRVSWNYIHNEIDHPLYDGDFGVLQTRVQLDF